MKKTILYIHGYGGSANGGSSKLIRKYLDNNKYELIGIDYNETDPVKAREDIKIAIKKHNASALIGSSLGGLLTLTMFGIPRIVINPCIMPRIELPKIGASKEYADKFGKYEQWFEDVTTNESKQVIGVFADNDELLGSKYVIWFKNRFSHVYRCVGGHHVSDHLAREITILLEDLFHRN